MVDVIPAILAKSFEEFEMMVRKLEPHVKRAHLDIMDGKFVPNTTIRGYEELKRIDTPLRFDVHLMIENPLDQMHYWYEAGSLDTILVHAEAQNGLEDLLKEIHFNHHQTGLVLNPETRPERVLNLLPLVDQIQFMTVHPGFYGKPFLEEVLLKIEDFAEQYPAMPISVDGGITPETAHKAVLAGVSTIVSGSYIMQSNDIAQAIQNLQHA